MDRVGEARGKGTMMWDTSGLRLAGGGGMHGAVPGNQACEYEESIR